MFLSLQTWTFYIFSVHISYLIPMWSKKAIYMIPFFGNLCRLPISGHKYSAWKCVFCNFGVECSICVHWIKYIHCFVQIFYILVDFFFLSAWSFIKKWVLKSFIMIVGFVSNSLLFLVILLSYLVTSLFLVMLFALNSYFFLILIDLS